MTAFELPEEYDFALLMLDSAAHLLAYSRYLVSLRNLQSVGSALREGGRYLLEMTHPAEFFDATPRNGQQLGCS